MSAPRAIVQLFIDAIRITGKATIAAGKQMGKNARHKPEGAPDARPIGSGSSKNALTSELNMSLEEAHMILNVKKEEPLEKILENYERIFKANGPPPPPKAPAAGSPEAAAARSAPKVKKGTQHSHYLQSKVYRALERIKAERGEGLAAEGEAVVAEGAEAAPGAAPGTAPGAAAEGAAKAGEAPKQPGA